jgi:glycosyltransferase involved in cell wall biosynthesis
MIQTFVSFAVYIGDEDRSLISPFLRIITSYVKQTFANYEIILVNDSIDERTKSLLEREASNLDSHFIILDLAYRHGLEHGMVAGLETAMGDYVFEIDSVHWNYQYTLLEDMLKRAKSGYDIVFAQSKEKRLLRSVSNILVDRLIHFPKNLPSGTVKVSSRRAINHILSFIESKKINKILFRNSLYTLTGYPFSAITYTPINNKKMPLLSKDGILNAFYFKLLYFKIRYFLFALCLFLIPFVYFTVTYGSDLFIVLGFLLFLFINIMYISLLLRNQYQATYQIKQIKVYKEKDQIFHIRQ